MHRFLTAALAALLALPVALAAADGASAKQKQRPSQRPQVIIQDRGMYGPPSPPSSQRNYYGPAPSIQAPMQRVPLPPPLAQPPVR
jgi:hypothetical protein